MSGDIRHRLPLPMQMESPIPKENFLVGGHTDGRTVGFMDRGEGGSHVTCQYITCHLSVQCNGI